MEFKLKYVPYVLFLLYQTLGLSQQKLFNQLSVNQGLSHSDVNSIVQDNYSYLWVGTNSGLNRYDGYDIETYKWEPNDILSIPGNRILKLIATKDKIWVLIENKGLYYYNLLTKSYVLVKEIPKLDPNNFMFDLGKDNKLWVFHKTIGLLKIDVSNRSTSTKSTFQEPIIEEKISFVKNKIALPSLKKLIKTEDEELFFTENGQLYIFSKKENKLVFYQDFKSGDFQTAVVKNSTEILVCLENGIFLWNSISNTKQRIPVLFNTNVTSEKIKLRSIYKNDDTYYLGTDNGVYKARLIQQNGLKLHINQELLSNVRVNSILKDKFDMLWIATAGYGLFYKNLKNLPFGHIHQSKNSIDAFSKNYTTAILKEKTSPTLWLGTKSGLLLYNLVSKKYVEEIKELENKQVRFIFQDSENDIWVGTLDDGVYRFRNKKLKAHFKKTRNNPSSISSNHIVSISEDYFGRIWLANYQNGIDIYTKKSNSFQHLFNESFNKESLASDNINYLFYDNNMNFMYVSTRDSGITVVHLNEETKFSYKHIGADNGLNNLSTSYIWSINSISSDSLFVGTIGGGLNILKKDKNNDYQIEYLTKRIGLADNDIESVLLDSENRVWMGGRGISVYDLKTKKITNYDVNDGLQSNSFKIGSSFYDDKEDIMYFGGVNGVNFFDPKLIKTNTTPSIAAITGIEVLNKRVKIGDTLNKRVLLHSKIADTTLINLKAEENDFSINITPINYTAPKSNKIKYRLKPYQKEWIERSYPEYKVSYSNLPAGDYNFEAQASNKDGVWSSKSAELKISIEKIWYKTTLAFFFYFAFSLALLYFLNKQTANKRRIREKLLNAEKEQLLNQGKLDFFTKISHEIRTPLTLISGPLNDLILKRKTGRNKEEVLASMSRHVNRLLNMTNKLLDFRKMELGHDVLLASPTEINEFTNEIFMFFKEKAFSKVITYEFIPLPQEITVHVDKEKIETILINLLSNAFKFTPNNGNITIKLSVNGDIDKDAVFNKYFEPIENYLEIAVADTGMGIPFSKKENIFNQYYQIEQNSSFEAIGNGIGLALVKSICNLHHLKLAVESKAKKGSIFSIRIPLGKSYLASDEIKNIDSYVKSTPPIVLHQTPTIDFNPNAIDLINKTVSPNKKILIVEDNAEIRQYLNQHLKEFFKVFNAENGAIGFETAMKEKPDIILSDVMMPEMNGLEFTKLVKTNDALHHIPIILLTALTSTSNELEGLKLGVEDYIRKPFEIDILLAKIFTILENRAFISEYYAKQLHFTPASLDGLTDDEIFLQKLIKFIEENLINEELNVALVSEHMAMGRTKLYVKIKETTGRSIVEFIRDIKLRKAENLLLSSSQTIEQISFQIGINDLKYFRKHFKAIYGLSPSQYRKSKK